MATPEESILIESETEKEREDWEDSQKRSRKDRARKKKCCTKIFCLHKNPNVKPEDITVSGL